MLIHAQVISSTRGTLHITKDERTIETIDIDIIRRNRGGYYRVLLWFNHDENVNIRFRDYHKEGHNAILQINTVTQTGTTFQMVLSHDRPINISEYLEASRRAELGLEVEPRLLTKKMPDKKTIRKDHIQILADIHNHPNFPLQFQSIPLNSHTDSTNPDMQDAYQYALRAFNANMDYDSQPSIDTIKETNDKKIKHSPDIQRKLDYFLYRGNCAYSPDIFKDFTWQTKDRQTLKLYQMATFHIINCLGILINRVKTYPSLKKISNPNLYYCQIGYKKREPYFVIPRNFRKTFYIFIKEIEENRADNSFNSSTLPTSIIDKYQSHLYTILQNLEPEKDDEFLKYIGEYKQPRDIELECLGIIPKERKIIF